MHHFKVLGRRELMGEEQAQYTVGGNCAGLNRPCLTQTLLPPEKSMIYCTGTRTTRGTVHMIGTILQARASRSLADAAAV